MMERARRMVFAAAVTAMGFVALQTPARATPACDGVGPCSDTLCARICRAAGFSGGFCNGGGGCSCYL